MRNKKTVFYFVFDGLADWEASYALAGINQSNRFRVRTIALDKNPKRSMSGADILPELDFLPWIDLHDIDQTNTAMLVLPGGITWREGLNQGIADLVIHCIQQEIPVAAIGDATTFLATLHVLNHVDHTGDDLVSLEAAAINYSGRDRYLEKAAVYDQGIITANGMAPFEFAKEVFDVLSIDSAEHVRQWSAYL